MRIVTIGYLHGSGGAERQIILLSNELSQRGHDVHLVILNENKAPYSISSSVNIHDLTKKEGTGKLSIIRRFLALRKALKTIRPDVTVNYNIQSTYFSLLIGRKICGKVLYSERGDPYDSEYSGLLGLIRDITCKYVDAFVFQSEGARDFFKLSSNQKSIVIHNSVTVPQEKYPMLRDRDNRIVTVGRLHPQKNPWLLLDSFSLIAEKHPEVTLEFYGDGPLKDQINQRIKSLGLTDRIHLNSSRNDIFDCIYNARMFILSSDYEGMPNALMEAMSLGLPCISTDCRPGGARTLIDNGVNGYIVPVGNSEAMSKMIDYLLEHPDIAESIAKEARKLGQTHTSNRIFEKWNNFLLGIKNN